MTDESTTAIPSISMAVNPGESNDSERNSRGEDSFVSLTLHDQTFEEPLVQNEKNGLHRPRATKFGSIKDAMVLMPYVDGDVRAKRSCVTDSVTLRSAVPLISPDNSTAERRCPPHVVMPMIPLKKRSGTRASFPSQPFPTKATKMGTEFVHNTSTDAVPDEQSTPTYFLDHESYHDRVVDKYLEKKYKECVLSGHTTLPDIPLVADVFAKRAGPKLYEETLAAASCISCEQPSSLCNEGEDSNFEEHNFLLKNADQKEHGVLGDSLEFLSLVAPEVETKSGMGSETDIPPPSPRVQYKTKRNDDFDHSCLRRSPEPDQREGTADKEAFLSPTESTGATSIETVEKEVTDEYAPIDLTRASSDDLYTSLLSLDPQLTFDNGASEKGDGNDTPRFTMSVQTTQAALSRVTPDPSRTNHKYPHLDHTFLEGNMMIEEIVDRNMPTPIMEEYSLRHSVGPFMLPVSTQIHPCTMAPESMSRNILDMSLDQVIPTLDPFLLNLDPMDERSESVLDMKQNPFYQDDEVFHWYCDDQKQDHMDFNNSIDQFLPHQMITHPYQHHVRAPKRVSICPADVQTSLAHSHWNSIPERTLGATGSCVVSEGTLKKNKKAPTKDNSKKSAVKRARTEDFPGNFDVSYLSSLESISTTNNSSDEATNNKEPKKKKKPPNRNSEEPNFSENHKRVWLQHYKDFKDFVRFHGHGLVPHDYPQNKMLARWVKRQVRNFPRCG